MACPAGELTGQIIYQKKKVHVSISGVLVMLAAARVAARRGFHSSRAPLSGSLSSHKNTPDNNEDTPFDFTAENYIKVLAPS